MYKKYFAYNCLTLACLTGMHYLFTLVAKWSDLAFVGAWHGTVDLRARAIASFLALLLRNDSQSWGNKIIHIFYILIQSPRCCIINQVEFANDNNKEHTYVCSYICSILICTLYTIVVFTWPASTVGLVKITFVAEDIATPT